MTFRGPIFQTRNAAAAATAAAAIRRTFFMDAASVSLVSIMNMPVQFTPPPRRVPLSLALVNVLNGFAQIGWIVFGFGMVFFWMFAGNADFSVITFRGDIAETRGKVTRVEETGASENDHTIIAAHYEYAVDGRTLNGTSYSTGSRVSEGEEVTVQYAAANPLRSRIEGMRRAHFGPWLIFVVIFPFVGFVILFFAMRSGFKRLHLLRHGLLATGTLTYKEPTNMTVNDRRVYELTFSFMTREGHKCNARATTSDPSRLEDDRNEPLLYDPNDPSRAYLLDEVPGRPEVSGVGDLVGRPVPAAFSLIVPGIVVGAHILYFL